MDEVDQDVVTRPPRPRPRSTTSTSSRPPSPREPNGGGVYSSNEKLERETERERSFNQEVTEIWRDLQVQIDLKVLINSLS